MVEGSIPPGRKYFSGFKKCYEMKLHKIGCSIFNTWNTIHKTIRSLVRSCQGHRPNVSVGRVKGKRKLIILLSILLEGNRVYRTGHFSRTGKLTKPVSKPINRTVSYPNRSLGQPVTSLKTSTSLEGSSLTIFLNISRRISARAGSNLHPFDCKARLVTTTLWVM